MGTVVRPSARRAGRAGVRVALRGAAVALVVAVAPAAAETGSDPWVLEAGNWERGKDLLPEPVLRRVRAGEYWFRIVPADPERYRRNYAESFWTASAANAGVYDLDPETCGLRSATTRAIPDNFFGFPFPRIASDDPQAGCKIAWNFIAAGYMGGGTGASFYLNGLETTGEYRSIRTRVRAMPLVGHYGPPRPNGDRLAVKAMTKALEPADVEGVSTLVVRHWNWTTADDVWAYVPATRRARRIHASARSEPVAGLDIFADDINCYAGKVEDYTWRLAGEGTTLAPVVLGPYAVTATREGPTRWLAPTPPLTATFELPAAERKGAPWLIVDTLAFVPRPAWIVEGESKDPYYNFGKVVMYFDRELYRVYWKLVHNKAGEYFYNAMCGYTFMVSADGAVSAVAPTVVVGVNDRANRAAIGGRSRDQFIEHGFDPESFSLRALRQRDE
jgi:hypothetical protein